MNRILILGGVSYNTMIYLDELPQPKPHTIFSAGSHETVGSTGAGKALNLSRLGLDVTLHALIGDDEYGRKIRRAFAAERFTFLHDIDPQGSQRHTNLMDKDGRRISIFLNPGAFEPRVDAARLETAIAACDVVALNIRNYCRHLIPLIQQHGREIWCDLHDYDGRNPFHQDFIEAAHVIHFSSDALPSWRPLMEQFIAQGKRLAICTHGRQGATALDSSDRWVKVPIIDAYTRLDSNGAGDAFFSGVLYGQINGHDLETSLRLGAVVSGLCVTSRELAFPGLSQAAVKAAYETHYGPMEVRL